MPKSSITLDNGQTVTLQYNQEQEDKVMQLMQTISTNDQAMKLIKQSAKSNQNLVVEFDPEMSKMYSQGESVPGQNQINIKGSLESAELLKTFIFELCNSINPAFVNLQSKKFDTGTDYAEYIEKHEATSFKLAFQIYDYGIKNSKWPDVDDRSQYSKLLDEEVWMSSSKQKSSNYNNATSHFDIYEKQFNQNSRSKTSSFDM